MPTAVTAFRASLIKHRRRVDRSDGLSGLPNNTNVVSTAVTAFRASLIIHVGRLVSPLVLYTFVGGDDVIGSRQQRHMWLPASLSCGRHNTSSQWQAFDVHTQHYTSDRKKWRWCDLPGVSLPVPV